MTFLFCLDFLSTKIVPFTCHVLQVLQITVVERSPHLSNWRMVIVIFCIIIIYVKHMYLNVSKTTEFVQIEFSRNLQNLENL